MAKIERYTVVAAFENRTRAQEAIQALHEAGFETEQIGIAAREDGPQSPGVVRGDKSNRLEDIAAAGAAAGGTLGAVAGALATGLIPGIGQVVAAGLLTGILGGTVLGAAAGGLIGALVGIGIPEEDARFYDREFLSGRAIVAVRAAGRSAEVADLLRQHGAYSVSSVKETATPPAPA